MSRILVALMVRTGIPYTVWLDQPDGVIETAVDMLADNPQTGPRDGPVMHG